MQLSINKLKLPSYHNRLMAATALLSIGLVAYQVAIIQLLSYVQWYHYANMLYPLPYLDLALPEQFFPSCENGYLIIVTSYCRY